MRGRKWREDTHKGYCGRNYLGKKKLQELEGGSTTGTVPHSAGTVPAAGYGRKVLY